ncbi:hypothetical protein PsAD13_02682 [Pseudovibrio sp. Ad13]|nr:hypothetical protein PsAD13_02682 [Pseudovibrio sp. Ad13]
MTVKDTDETLDTMTLGDMGKFHVDQKSQDLYWNNQRVHTVKRLDKLERFLVIIGLVATCISATAISANTILNYIKHF